MNMSTEVRERPRVWNKRDKNVPPNAVYVGRPTKWGNPFKVGPDGSRQTVIERYQNYITTALHHGTLDITELIGKDLVCWCHTWNGEGENPMHCHADILLELANQ